MVEKEPPWAFALEPELPASKSACNEWAYHVAVIVKRHVHSIHVKVAINDTDVFPVLAEVFPLHPECTVGHIGILHTLCRVWIFFPLATRIRPIAGPFSVTPRVPNLDQPYFTRTEGVQFCRYCLKKRIRMPR